VLLLLLSAVPQPLALAHLEVPLSAVHLEVALLDVEPPLLLRQLVERGTQEACFGLSRTFGKVLILTRVHLDHCL
jgi:hypothetical protein